MSMVRLILPMASSGVPRVSIPHLPVPPSAPSRPLPTPSPTLLLRPVMTFMYMLSALAPMVVWWNTTLLLRLSRTVRLLFLLKQVTAQAISLTTLPPSLGVSLVMCRRIGLCVMLLPTSILLLRQLAITLNSLFRVALLRLHSWQALWLVLLIMYM